ncbi:hypothetical protein H7K33_04740 [Mycobacterium paraense]|uniref:hypothetical protein n=1 Tax=Mycobacterium paraense TaxID=767916 RepID=UPI00114F00A4|nr:hypothetical protein [Mycobacterium paraense]MCV7441526.1 hypothetical protein [Mycobacterium paraense]
MFYTPGWGALLTAVSTLTGALGGVAITQWNSNRQSAREYFEARRSEQRLAVLDVMEPAAMLTPKMRRFASLIDRAAAGEAVQDIEAFYGPAYKEAVTQKSELTRAIRKAALIITEPKIAEALEGLEKAADDLAAERSAAGLAAERGQPDSTALRRAIDTYNFSALRLRVVAREQLTRRS